MANAVHPAPAKGANFLRGLAEKHVVHPLVVQLTAGLCIFSQAFLGDLWLVYKNKHIVVSCFTVHPDHYFNASERYWVLVISLSMAFALSALFAFAGKNVECEAAFDYVSESYNNGTVSASGARARIAQCMGDQTFKTSTGTTIGFSICSAVLQMFYDQFAQFVVTCACVQNCNNCIKHCAEGVGKIAFTSLAFLGVVFLIGSVYLITEMGGEFITSFSMFACTRIFNFLLLTSFTLIVTFFLARRAQMKVRAQLTVRINLYNVHIHTNVSVESDEL